MPVLNFVEFARRRAPAPPPSPAPVTDRWATLHAATEATHEAAAPVVLPTARDFWGDLLLRMAYPTHRLRQH